MILNQLRELTTRYKQLKRTCSMVIAQPEAFDPSSKFRLMAQVNRAKQALRKEALVVRKQLYPQGIRP